MRTYGPEPSPSDPALLAIAGAVQESTAHIKQISRQLTLIAEVLDKIRQAIEKKPNP